MYRRKQCVVKCSALSIDIGSLIKQELYYLIIITFHSKVQKRIVFLSELLALIHFHDGKWGVFQKLRKPKGTRYTTICFSCRYRKTQLRVEEFTRIKPQSLI